MHVSRDMFVDWYPFFTTQFFLRHSLPFHINDLHQTWYPTTLPPSVAAKISHHRVKTQHRF